MSMGKYCAASSLRSDSFGHIADTISFFTIEPRSEYFYFHFPDEDSETQRDEIVPPVAGIPTQVCLPELVLSLFHDPSSVHSAPTISYASDFCFPVKDADFKPWTSIVFINDKYACTVPCRLLHLLSGANKTPVASRQWLLHANQKNFTNTL